MCMWIVSLGWSGGCRERNSEEGSWKSGKKYFHAAILWDWRSQVPENPGTRQVSERLQSLAGGQAKSTFPLFPLTAFTPQLLTSHTCIVNWEIPGTSDPRKVRQTPSETIRILIPFMLPSLRSWWWFPLQVSLAICLIELMSDWKQKSKEQWHNSRIIITILIYRWWTTFSLSYMTKATGIRTQVLLTSFLTSCCHQGDSVKVLPHRHLHISHVGTVLPGASETEEARSYWDFHFILFDHKDQLNFNGKEIVLPLH